MQSEAEFKVYVDRNNDSKVYKAVESLREALGWNTSETASECFLIELEQAIKQIKKSVKDSHRKGLAWDCCYDLARTLEELYEQNFSLTVLEKKKVISSV